MRSTILLLPLLLASCIVWRDLRDGAGPDTDADGLTDGQELALGLDPDDPDTDDDRLGDGAEVDEWQTDPLDPDTDDDGYLDGDEVTEGSDPTTSASRIYVGHWPYYPDKDAISGADGGSVATEGSRFRRFELRDQFGDRVDLYDFYDPEGPPVVVNMSGQLFFDLGLANWLAARKPPFDEEFEKTLEKYDPVRQAVDDGEVRWITVLSNGAGGGGTTPTAAEAEAWHVTFNHPNVPVLVDRNLELFEYLDTRAFPTLVVLSPRLRVNCVADGVPTCMDYLMGQL